jgi:hypothetical protein
MTEQVPTKDHAKLVDALYNVGGAWARYGLSVGRAALETSAVTLRNTAAALGEISEALERRTRERVKEAGDEPTVSDAPQS